MPPRLRPQRHGAAGQRSVMAGEHCPAVPPTVAAIHIDLWYGDVSKTDVFEMQGFA